MVGIAGLKSLGYGTHNSSMLGTGTIGMTAPMFLNALIITLLFTSRVELGLFLDGHCYYSPLM